MKYLLLICDEDPDSMTAQGQAGTSPDAGAPTRQEEANSTERQGILVTGNPTHPAVAATVRFLGGDVLVTDGPYARVQGQIRGFDVIDGEQLDEVIELASRVPEQRPAQQPLPQSLPRPGPQPGLPGPR